MNSASPVIETARLMLRPPTQDDFAFLADEEASHFIGGPQLPHMACRGMATTVGRWALKGFAMVSAIERETGRWK
jgi:hypothetical protein